MTRPKAALSPMTPRSDLASRLCPAAAPGGLRSPARSRRASLPGHAPCRATPPHRPAGSYLGLRCQHAAEHRQQPRRRPCPRRRVPPATAAAHAAAAAATAATDGGGGSPRPAAAGTGRRGTRRGSAAAASPTGAAAPAGGGTRRAGAPRPPRPVRGPAARAGILSRSRGTAAATTTPLQRPPRPGRRRAARREM